MPSDPYFSSVVLLLHCDGADASTTFTDSEATPKTVTADGNAQLDTAQFKWGTASGLFDGASDHLSLDDHADWDFGSGDFTIECWLRLNNNGSRGALFSQDDAGLNYAPVMFDFGGTGGDGKLHLWASSTGSSWDVLNDQAGTTVLNAGQWYHLALTRSGITWRAFIDGVQEFSVDAAGTLFNSTHALNIGAFQGTPSIDGWIDDIRVTKGVARYTSGFTPPTEAFPDSGDPTPGTASLVLTGYAPQVQLFLTETTPSVGSLTLSGETPSAQIKTTIAPDAGALAAGGAAPEITRATPARPAAGALGLVGAAPNLNRLVPETGALTLAGYAPIVTNVAIRPGAGSLILESVASRIANALLTVQFDVLVALRAPLVVQFDVQSLLTPPRPLVVTFDVVQANQAALTVTFDVVPGVVHERRTSDDVQAPVAEVVLA